MSNNNNNLLYHLQICVYIQVISSSLSVLGSSILLTSLCRTKQSFSRIYFRLMYCITIMDLIFSISYGLGPVPIPKELGIPGSKGTWQTCSAQGYFRQLGFFGSMGYSCMILIYYVLFMRFRWTEQRLVKHVEPIMHFVVLIFSIINATYGVIIQVFNPVGYSGCWTGSFPLGCSAVAEIPCIRGENAPTYVRQFGNIPSLIILSIIILCLLILTITVITLQSKARNITFSSRPNLPLISSSSPSSPRPQQRQQRRRSSSVFESHSQEVQIQCLLYAFSFLNANIWINITVIIRSRTGSISLWSFYMTMIFTPLLGLFNCIVFLRPRYLIQRKQQGESRIRSIANIIWDPISPSDAQVSSRTMRHVVVNQPQNQKQNQTNQIVRKKKNDHHDQENQKRKNDDDDDHHRQQQQQEVGCSGDPTSSSRLDEELARVSIQDESYETAVDDK